MFSIGDTRCLSWLALSAAFPENLSDHLPTRVFIQQTSNLNIACISELSRGFFFIITSTNHPTGPRGGITQGNFYSLALY